MEVICQTKDLLKPVTLLTKLIPERVTHPILGNLLLETNNNYLLLTASNLSTTMQFKVPASEFTEGKITVPAKIFENIISKIVDSQFTIRQAEDNAIELVANKYSYRIQGMAANEFPDFQKLEPKIKFSLPLQELVDGLQNALYASSDDETKLVLTGLRLSIDSDGAIEFAATDGHRLALKSSSVDELSPKNLAFTIPSEVLEYFLAGIMATVSEAEYQELANVEADDREIIIQFQHLTATGRLFHERYPNYKQLIPTQFEKVLTLNRLTLIHCLERVRLFSGQGKTKNLVSMTCNLLEDTKYNLVFKGKCYEGEASEFLPVDNFQLAENANPVFHVALNAKYVLESLKKITTEQVALKLNGEAQPILLTPANASSPLHMIMPLQYEEYQKRTYRDS